MTQERVTNNLGRLKQRWPAVLGLILCLVLWVGWCPGGGCHKGALLSIPWAGWGTGFYALCVLVPQSWLMFLAVGGLVVHVYLTAVMVSKLTFCVACNIAAVLTAALFVKSASSHSNNRVGLWGLIAMSVTVVILLWQGLLFVSPSTPETPVGLIGSVPYQAASAVAVVEQSATPPAAVVEAIEAATPDGSAVSLDPAEKPVLLFASWCDHCLDPLVVVAQLPPEHQPFLVAVYWDGGVQETEDKLRQAGLGGATYYTSDATPESIPRLITTSGDVKGEQKVCTYLRGEAL